MREPSRCMALNYLEEAFPCIPYSTMEELFMECGESANVVAQKLTEEPAKQANEDEDSNNLSRLLSLFPQFSNIIEDCFISFSFDFGKTVDFLHSLSSPFPPPSILTPSPTPATSTLLNFSASPSALPVPSASSVHSLSSQLSSPVGHTSGRRPFRCPYCGFTSQSYDFRFCPQCGHPLNGRPRL